MIRRLLIETAASLGIAAICWAAGTLIQHDETRP